MKASLTLFPTLSFTANILNGLNSYCTTFQMNHTPCWAFCESIPVLGYIWAYLLRKKILAVSFCGHLDHEKLRMLTRQSKKVAGPTPLQSDRHTHRRRTMGLLKKYWNFDTPIEMFSTFPWTHISQIAMLYHSVIWIIIYPLGGRTKKTTFWCSVPPQILDSIFLHFLSQDVLQGFVFLHTKYSGKAIHIIIENSISAQKSW